MEHKFSRRDLLRGTGSLAVVLPIYSRKAIAQEQSGAAYFKLKIEQLEEQAVERKLPEIRGPSRGPIQALSDQNLYLDGMPRLLTVIERAERQQADDPLAQQAATLLSELHASVRLTPEFFARRRAPAPKLDNLRGEYQRLFGSCQISPGYISRVNWHLERLKAGQAQYQAVSDELRIPWYFIGIIHALEASFNFRGHLHNGDPLAGKTKQVPSGRPTPWLPPSDWQASAKDALQLLGMAHKSDWGLEDMLYRLELYNGFGYRRRRVNSAYLWSFSNHYTKGKYVRDGVWDPNAKSQQCGAAVMLKSLVDNKVIKL